MVIDAPPAMSAPPPGLPVLPAGFSAERAARRAARELGGAVVVVEDDLLPLPPSAPPLRLGWFRFSDGALPPGPSALPAWMDPGVVRAGGNVVHRTYTFGGTNF
jgi:hypothetical protein